MGLFGTNKALNAPEKANMIEMTNPWKVEGRPLKTIAGTRFLPMYSYGTKRRATATAAVRIKIDPEMVVSIADIERAAGAET